MTDFRQYLASPATAERPSAGELDALAARYEWFAPVRIAREIVTGICDPRLAVTAPWRAQSSLLRRPIDAEAVLRLSSDDIIDRFLQEDDLRIVAADGEPEGAHISHLPFLLSEKRSGTLRTQSLIFPVLSRRYENGVTDT